MTCEAPADEPLVYVAVLAWNHKEDTLECLASLRRMNYRHSRWLLVDNGSTDGTADEVRKRFPQVEILRSDINLGIAGGYNLAIEYALNHHAEHVLVTNNDVIVDPEMLSEMIEAAEGSERVGVIVPKIYYYDRRDVIWCAGARWRPLPPEFKMIGNGHRDGPQYSQMQDIDYAPSCTLLLKREALQEVGYFDPQYFFYYDDWDFTERMRKKGYRILFVPRARMWHKVAASTQKSDKPARWWFVLGQSSVRFYLAHRTPTILFINNVWFLMREVLKLNFGRLLPYVVGVCNGLAQSQGWTS